MNDVGTDLAHWFWTLNPIAKGPLQLAGTIAVVSTLFSLAAMPAFEPDGKQPSPLGVEAIS